jgi:cell division transport system permease protein
LREKKTLGIFKWTEEVLVGKGLTKMKNIFYNIGYFIKEAKIMIRLNLMSKSFSILSTGLMFFLLAMVVSGWWASCRVVEAIEGEAEISVYYIEGIGEADIAKLIQKVKEIEGVHGARIVEKDEAYKRMVEVLGKEAAVLEYLDDNPFSPFLEAKINMEKMSSILEKLNVMTEVEHVRDNREVLERLKSVAGVMKILGYLFVISVTVCTLLIISHIIRLGIYNNREQIKTLRLLGAPEYFIAFPFLLEGLVLTLGGGILSTMMTVVTIKSIYTRMASPLPFIPIPSLEPLISGIIFLTILLSTALGIMGSLLGMRAAKGK